jgi:hypothetical protein
MSEVTESLLKELLNNPITVAIYGGGFKPPTKGHFTVAQKTLKELPDIDELKIFVGGGVRDGITQNESVQIWKIYQPYLSNKIEVEPVSSPVKAVLDYAKENPDEKVYWILGAREGDEDDLKDIENRTKSLDKYPNIEVKIITTAGGVSGTKTRASISSGNKEDFFNLIPNIQEKEEIWNILSPIVKEGIVDNMKTKIKDFISAVKQEGQETKEAFKLILQSAKGEIELTDEQKEQIGNQLKDVLKTIGLTAIATLPGGFIVAALLKIFKQTHFITPSSFLNEVGEANLSPYKWKESERWNDSIYITFNTESETIYEVILVNDKYKNIPVFNVEFLAKLKGSQGLSHHTIVNKGEIYKVMSTITDIIKKYLLKFKKVKGIVYSPSKKEDETFESQRDKLYKAFIKKSIPNIQFETTDDGIIALMPGVVIKDSLVNEIGEASTKSYNWKEKYNRNVIHDRNVIGVEFITDKGTEYEVALSISDYSPKNLSTQLKALSVGFSTELESERGYIYRSSDAIMNKGELYRVMATITNIIKYYVKKYNIKIITYSPSKKGNEAFGTQRDKLYKAFIKKAIPGVEFEQDGEAVVAILPDSKIEEKSNDPFGINAYARELVKETFKEDWNLKEGMLSLSKYMIDNGMNIKPLPKIKVIDNDAENASNLLGKTAYYNPVEKSITLFTMNRHPKDVLRSFAHEMVHHMQNLEGRLNNIVTQNTNEDGDLPEIEREAYEKGNMMLRNWEDNIKNV